MKGTKQIAPSLEAMERELTRVKFNSRYRKLLRSTLYALIVTAAVAALIATLVLPVLQIYGSSMTPTPCVKRWKARTVR